MYKVLAALLLMILNVDSSDIRDTGPYYIPDWQTPMFKEGKVEVKSDVLIYESQLNAFLISARSWRYVERWKFLNQHFPEVNSWVIVPGTEEASQWVKQQQCKVGTTYETSRSDDCYKDLDNQDRNKWISPRTLKMTPPAVRPYMSTCSIYYSCDIHKVKFPIYINGRNFKPYISGPHGENIDISGDGSFKVIRMEDSFLVFSSIPKIVDGVTYDTDCIWQGEDADFDISKLYCNYFLDDAQYTIIFNEKDKKVAFNNYIFYRPKYEIKKRTDDFLFAPADPATKGDLKELENKLLLRSKDNLFFYHELLQELSNLKHILRALILSVAKIDDNLIGKITRLPIKTKWLNDDIFVLTSNVESLYHNILTDKNESCLGSYVYQNGRWKIAVADERQCSNWNFTVPLKIMENRISSPFEILNAPEYRNASNAYSGWTFLDDGKTSLDWLDKGLRYKPGGGGLDLNINGFDFMKILMLVIYLIIGIIVISLIFKVLRMLK